MKIDKNDVLTLSDNINYLVIGNVNYNYKNYLYLVDILNNSNIKIVENLNNDLIIIEDNGLLDKLLIEFIRDVKIG